MRPTRFPVRVLTLGVAAALAQLGGPGLASAGGLFWHHGGYSQTTRVTSYGSAPVAVSIPVTSIPVFTAVAPQPGVAVVQAPPGQSFQAVAPPLQIYQLAPAQQSLSLGATRAVLSLQGGSGPMNLASGASNGGVISLSASPTDPVSQNDALFLAAVSNNASFFQTIEKFVRDELQNLVNGRGQGLNNNDLEAILLGLVKAALPSPFAVFAPEISKAIDLIIQRIIHRVVAGRPTAPPAAPLTPPGSVTPIPLNPSGGAQAFDVSGRIIFTPVPATNPAPPNTAPPGAPVPPPPPADPAQNPANDPKPAPRPVR